MTPAAVRDRWRAARRYLDGHRHQLGRAAAHRHPGLARIPGTIALTRTDWLPSAPIPLADVRLDWDDDPGPAAVTGAGPEAADARAGYPTYAAALTALAPPRLLEDRFTYRLTGLSVTSGRLTYGPGSYFAGLDVGEALAHELAAAVLAGRDPLTARLPLRDAVGDPTDPARRPMTTAISVLTLRHDRRSGTATFPLHRRDASGVAHAGGLDQVLPVGVFQPSGPAPATRRADLDLWRCAVREYAEELLGAPEDYPEPFDYDRWPPYRALTDARASGRLRAYLLGVAVDPLTAATDLLAVTVIEAAAFDAVFPALARTTPEGTLTGLRLFTPESVRHLATSAPLQPAGAAVLTLAARHRGLLGV